MPIGYVTANQGESRYTVAIPRKTPLLAALIEARRVEIEGIDRVLEELRKHETDRRAVYDQAMVVVDESMAGYTECRESYTEPQCRTDKIAAANSAYSDARNACDDTWRDCRDGCDIGDGDCSDACDESREACELVAETARDRALAAVDRLCADEVVAHLQACQAQWSPVIASAQAAAVEALAPLQDAMIAITWERTKRTSAVRRLNELLGVQSRAEMATCWSAQYNEEIPVGELPEDPTGSEENAVTVATVSGRAVITEISSATPCVHDARALPADVLFVDSALAPGAETWRPTWRTGIVTAINEDGTLKVRIDPAILPGTLGTTISRRDIECTPPGAFFDEDGELDARLGMARQEYDDALEDLADVRAEIQTCKDGYTVQACTEPRNEVCEYNREQSMHACIDNRDYCLSIAQDANGEQYCLDQFAACEQQVDAIFSACVDGATADCIAAKAQHDAQCEQTSRFALSQAETAVSTARRNLLSASADIQGPPAELIRDLPVAHCSASAYEVGDDVLIDFPAREASAGLDWATATSAQIRAAAMAVWQSARVVGWASETRRCSRFQVRMLGESSFVYPSFGCGVDPINMPARSNGSDGEWSDGSRYVTWEMSTAYRDGIAYGFASTVRAACRLPSGEIRAYYGTGIIADHVGGAPVVRGSRARPSITLGDGSTAVADIYMFNVDGSALLAYAFPRAVSADFGTWSYMSGRVWRLDCSDSGALPAWDPVASGITDAVVRETNTVDDGVIRRYAKSGVLSAEWDGGGVTVNTWDWEFTTTSTTTFVFSGGGPEGSAWSSEESQRQTHQDTLTAHFRGGSYPMRRGRMDYSFDISSSGTVGRNPNTGSLQNEYAAYATSGTTSATGGKSGGFSAYPSGPLHYHDGGEIARERVFSFVNTQGPGFEGVSSSTITDDSVPAFRLVPTADAAPGIEIATQHVPCGMSVINESYLHSGNLQVYTNLFIAGCYPPEDPPEGYPPARADSITIIDFDLFIPPRYTREQLASVTREGCTVTLVRTPDARGVFANGEPLPFSGDDVEDLGA